MGNFSISRPNDFKKSVRRWCTSFKLNCKNSKQQNLDCSSAGIPLILTSERPAANTKRSTDTISISNTR